MYAVDISSTYAKQFLALEVQLERLVERGMYVRDDEWALRRLQAIGYYRLSGYWYPFRDKSDDPGKPRPSTFSNGTTLDEVVEIYCFDERLRAKLLTAIARIEVALRFWVGNRLGRRGPFAHTDATQLDPSWSELEERTCNHPDPASPCSWQGSAHNEWLAKQQRVEEISNEAFVAHIHNNYGKPLPIWTATETMTFESLNRLYSNMTPQDREQIAVEFDALREDGNGDVSTFANWIEHLRQSRNFCAHHARLWNRNHTAPLAVPYSSPELQHLLSPNVHDGGARDVSLAARRTYYPSFQFDVSAGDVDDIVILANRRLLNGGQGSEEVRWSALEWWLTPLHVLGEDTSPLDALSSNVLTREILDGTLAPRSDEQSRSES